MTEIIDDPSEYGSKGQTWAPEFVSYMKYIVTHPIYAGMPDAVKEDGKIQWEAPSNRSGGKYQFTHNKRSDWWRNKAESVGIDPNSDQWISRTAKLIHPTGEKPCKKCGTVMIIPYVYPQKNLISRFNKIFREEFVISSFDPITDVILNAYDTFGDNLFKYIQPLLQAKSLDIPEFNDLDTLISWLESTYIPQEPSLLSPGVMSNAPDRFDGFHSFNKCCRGKADKGRHINNLRSYTTDRRVFEFWSEGDWIAADRLMGLVRTKFIDEGTADGGKGPPTADHIGPISLGFCHRPEFQLLSNSANSAKNNRMSLSDIQHLISSEDKGVQVVSWYAKSLWDLRKTAVVNDENALRLSKILRDNQRNAMRILCYLFEKKCYAFLAYLLELGYADRKVEFENLRAESFITIYDTLIEKDRVTKYSMEQKARRIRIGFNALEIYMDKSNRHSFIVAEDESNKYVDEAILLINKSPKNILELNNKLEKILLPKTGIVSEVSLRYFVGEFPTYQIEEFERAKSKLSLAMNEVGIVLNDLWSDDRYVR